MSKTFTYSQLLHTPLRASWGILISSNILLNIAYILVMISIAFSFISYTRILQFHL